MNGWDCRASALFAAGCLFLLAAPARADTFHVATTGSDETGDGSEGRPWRTIAYAVNDGIPADGGHTVLVADGVYEGMNTIRHGFPEEVVVRAENAYGATLTNVGGGGEVIRVYVQGSARIAFEGFVMTNHHESYDCAGGREPLYLVHIQDADDVTLRNNVIFGNNAPGTCNEVVKINRSTEEAYPRGILIQGNVLYEPANAGGADIIDSVRPGEIDIVDNVFFGDPAADQSQSFITIKRQVQTDDARSPRFRIARNVFLRWGGKTDQAFVQFGEDGVPELEATDVLIENNLFLGDSPARMAAPIQLKGARGVVIRANTTVGDLPAGAFALRIGTEGDNPAVGDVQFLGNVFCDPTGTMGDRLVNSYGDVDVETITLDRNLFWNAGNALPSGGAPTPAADASRIEQDPLLETDHSDVVLPRWDADAGAFESGSTTIREEFLRLVLAYAAIPETSPARDAADPDRMPADDIRGLARDGRPDVGAFEYGADEPLPDAGPGRDGGADADTDVDGDVDVDSDGDVDLGGGRNRDSGCGCAAARPARTHGALALVVLLCLAARGRSK